MYQFKKTSAFLATALSLVTVQLGSVPASGAGLEPKRLDDIIHLTTAGGDNCTGGLGSPGRTFATRIIDRGGALGSENFGFSAIPQGKALVVTWAEISATSGTPFDSVQFRLFNQQGAGGSSEYFRGFRELDSDGNASMEVSFPNGVVLRSIEYFCAQAAFTSAVNVQGIVHGFLIDD